MISRQTRSAPVVWTPREITSSRDGRRKDIGRTRTVDHDASSHYGEHPKNPDGLKVFVVDYKKGVNALWCASMFTSVQMAIGALNMCALIYSLTVRDFHTVLCSMAFHLFSVKAILAMSYKNGWSLLMGYKNRRRCHVILQILALIMAIIGITLKLVKTGVTQSAHCIAGLTTAAIAILAFIFGPIGLFTKSKLLKTIHMFIGLITFLCASICFCLALFINKFTEWCKKNSQVIQIIMIILVVYICLVIIILVICKVADVDMLRAERRHRK